VEHGKSPQPLAASVSETTKIAETVESRIRPVQGLVAILDALGTKLLSLPEAVEFVALRDSILRFTAKVIETGLPGLDRTRLRTFTLNDTIVYVYEPPGDVTLAEVERFCHILRVAETRSIVEGFPFRGAFAVGEFFVGDEQTVLGPAVNDAASWFEAADWIGIHATPHATIFIQSLMEKSPDAKLEHVLVDYDVPLKKETTGKELKAVNWPKGFYVKGVRPPGGGTTKGLVLSALSARRVPRDTESKYFNAIKFFDNVEGRQHLEERFSATPSPSPAPPGSA
jgi:hypothetical protein